MKRVHCIGIGGIGISAIARVLLEQGVQVTGSDLCRSAVATALAESGATVFDGHNPSHVGDVDAVLISSAISEDNPEVVEAKRRGIPVLRREEFLGRLMRDKLGIAVAGTHGKTSTASMIAWILSQAGLDPTFVVGGIIESLHTNARSGRGVHFVIEADEYDRMFLGLSPIVAAITHLEHDHPDCFPTFAEMSAAFEQFLDRVPSDGLIVGCADQPMVAELLRKQERATVRTCGLGNEHDWHAWECSPNELGGHDFKVLRGDETWGRVRLRVPGLHNVQNALIAVVVADWLGVDSQTVSRALITFSGVERRFQIRGQVKGITVVDDYGHHPTKIRATLDAARIRYGDRPLWAVFQPHTFSRLKAMWEAFAESFEQADHTIVLDVYGARETNSLGISAADFASKMDHRDARHIADFDSAVQYIVSHVEPDAVIITLSAGDGNIVGLRVLGALKESEET